MGTVDNRLTALFARKPRGLLSIFTTAGFPGRDDTARVCRALGAAGADMIEIGIPFSDPVADGPTIQQSSEIALKNGMNLKLLFQQLAGIRREVQLPLLLMGYLNPILQFGFERFADACAESGVDGLILPDLPLREYAMLYRGHIERANLSVCFLVTPDTPPERLQAVDELTSGFIYAVSSPAITGGRLALDEQRSGYFRRLAHAGLTNPILVGFGIADRPGFEQACEYTSGAIIGSEFIRRIGGAADLEPAIRAFVREIKGSDDN